MPESSWRDEVPRIVRRLRVFVGVMVAGFAVFLTVVIVLVQQRAVPRLEELAPPLTYSFIAFAVTAILARLVVPGMIVARARRAIVQGTWRFPQTPQLQLASPGFFEEAGDAGKVLFILVFRTVVATAILETPAFFGAVTYMIAQSVLGLASAIVLILGVGAHMPTVSGVVRWTEDQLTLIDEQRQFGR